MSRIIIVLSCFVIAMHAGTISFDELQTSAIEHSSRLKLRNIDTSIETARLESVYSTLYPQLSLGYSGEYSVRK